MSIPPKKTDIAKKVRCGEAIEVCGLTLYPLTVSHYDEFLNCKDGLLLRQSAFPARLAVMDYLSSLFAADTDERYSDLRTGAFAKAIRFLLLALRIEAEDEVFADMFYLSHVGDMQVLSKIVIVQNGAKTEITPSDFSQKIRPILCLQNALELPDENINIDLLKAYEAKRALKNENVDLKTDTASLISTVAYMTHRRIAEIYDLTIWEFENLRAAIEREKMFTIYKTAELSGMVDFKNGNPVPSLFFDRVDDTLGTRTLAEVGKQIEHAKNGGELPQQK